jgi:predicted dehydrogenase
MGVKREQSSSNTNGHAESNSNVHLPVLRVGIIGCGEISQVAHIPTINFLSHQFQTTYLCDISEQSLQHYAGRVLGGPPKVTCSAEELCASPDVDVVIVANADAYHVEHVFWPLRATNTV